MNFFVTKLLLLVVSVFFSLCSYASEDIDPKIKDYIDKKVMEGSSSHGLDFGGYFRAGTNMFARGGSSNSGQCYSLNYPKNDGIYFRLGNECRDYAEFSFSHKRKTNGLEYKSVFMFDIAGDSRSPTATEGWSRRARQLYIEFKGLFGGDSALWVGRRLYRSIGSMGDFHIIDGFYVQSSGNGLGVSDVKLGSFMSHFALIGQGGTSSSDPSIDEQNYLLDIRFDTGVNKNSYQIALQNLFTTAAPGKTSRKEGRTLTLQWQRKFGIVDNKLGAQLGQGSMAENPGCFGTDGNCYSYNAKSSDLGYRLFLNGLIDWGKSFAVRYIAFYQKSDDYNQLTNVGVRPHYMLSKYWSLLCEAGVNSYQTLSLGAKQDRQELYKATFAIQATPDAGNFWERPSLRLYVSRFNWNNAAASQSSLSAPGTSAAKNSTVLGAQSEIWF